MERPATERTYPMPKVSSGGCAVRWSSEWWRGDILHPRSAVAALRRYPNARQGAAAALCWSSREEIPHVQGKRNPSKMVGAEKGNQRADKLKPQSQETKQSNHMDHSLL